MTTPIPSLNHPDLNRLGTVASEVLTITIRGPDAYFGCPPLSGEPYTLDAPPQSTTNGMLRRVYPKPEVEPIALAVGVCRPIRYYTGGYQNRPGRGGRGDVVLQNETRLVDVEYVVWFVLVANPYRTARGRPAKVKLGIASEHFLNEDPYHPMALGKREYLAEWRSGVHARPISLTRDLGMFPTMQIPIPPYAPKEQAFHHQKWESLWAPQEIRDGILVYPDATRALSAILAYRGSLHQRDREGNIIVPTSDAPAGAIVGA